MIGDILWAFEQMKAGKMVYRGDEPDHIIKFDGSDYRVMYNCGYYENEDDLFWVDAFCYDHHIDEHDVLATDWKVLEKIEFRNEEIK